MKVWIVNISDEFGSKPPVVYATREGAIKAARARIRHYFRLSIEGVEDALADFDEQVSRGDTDICAGDPNALFNVSVIETEVKE